MSFKLKQHVLIILSALVFGVFGICLYAFLERQSEAIIAEKQAYICSLEDVSGYQDELVELGRRLSELKFKLKDFDEAIPSERDIGPFLHKIAVLMDKHNLKEQRVVPGQEMPGDQVNSIPVEMECKGGIVEIYEFYDSLEALKRLIRIEEITLVNSTDFSGEIKMRTRAKIYFRTESSKG